MINHNRLSSVVVSREARVGIPCDNLGKSSLKIKILLKYGYNAPEQSKNTT